MEEVQVQEVVQDLMDTQVKVAIQKAITIQLAKPVLKDTHQQKLVKLGMTQEEIAFIAQKPILTKLIAMANIGKIVSNNYR